MHAIMPVWRSEDCLQESVLAFTMYVVGIKLGLSGSVAGFLILHDISPTFETDLPNA